MVSRTGCHSVASNDKIIAFCRGNVISLVDIQTEKTVFSESLNFRAHGLRFVSSEDLLVWGENHLVTVSGGCICRRYVADDWILSAVVLPAGVPAVITVRNHVELLYPDRAPQKYFPSVSSLLYSADLFLELDGSLLVFGGSVLSEVHVWRIDFNSITQVSCQSFNCHKGSVFSVAYYPAKKKLLTCSDDRTAVLWSVDEKKILVPEKKFPGHNARVWDAVLGADWVATACEDGVVRVFDFEGDSKKFQGHKGDVWALACLGEDVLLSAGEDGDIKRWDLSAHGNSFSIKTPLSDKDFIKAAFYVEDSWFTISHQGNVRRSDGGGDWMSSECVPLVVNEKVSCAKIVGTIVWVGSSNGSLYRAEIGHDWEPFRQAIPVKVISIHEIAENKILATNHCGDFRVFGRRIITGCQKTQILCACGISGKFATGDEKGWLRLWGEDGELIKSQRIFSDAQILSVSVCGNFLSVTSSSGIFAIIDFNLKTNSLTKISTIPHLLGCLDDDKLFGFSGSDFVVWSAIDHCETIRVPEMSGHRARFTVHGNFFCLALNDGAKAKLICVDLRAKIGRTIRKGLDTSAIHGLAEFDNSMIVAVCEDNSVKVISENLEICHAAEGHTSSVRCVAVGGGQILTAGARSEVRLWEFNDGLTLINSARVCEEEVRVLSCCWLNGFFYLGDSTGKIYSFDGISFSAICSGLQGAVLSLVQSDNTLMAGLSNGLIMKKSINSCFQVQTHSAGVNALVVLGKDLLLSAGDDQRICLLEICSMTILSVLDNAHHSSIRAMSLIETVSLNQWRVASIGWERRVRTWTISRKGIEQSNIPIKLDITDPSALITTKTGKLVSAGKGIQINIVK